MPRVPDKLFNLKPVPTEELIGELTTRGIDLVDELPWEDCGDCEHIKGMHGKYCGADRKPTFLDKLRGGDPHYIGFYAIQCPRREPRADRG